MSPSRACMAVLVAALGCAPLACTLLTSFDGFTDGQLAPGEGGIVDERADVIAAEASPEAQVAVEAGPSRYATAVLTDSPLLYYRFGEKDGAPARDEISGSTVPYSVAGLTLGAPGALAGDLDTAITSDGSGEIKLTQAADFEGRVPFSVEVWANVAATSSDIGFVVDHEIWDGNRRGWALRVGNTTLGFERWEDQVTNSSIGTAQTPDGKWHHIVVTFDGSNQRLYVDNVRRDSTRTALQLPKIGIPFTVGKQNCAPCGSTGFTGSIDELAIYTKALTEERIGEHFAAAR